MPKVLIAITNPDLRSQIKTALAGHPCPDKHIDAPGHLDLMGVEGWVRNHGIETVIFDPAERRHEFGTLLPKLARTPQQPKVVVWGKKSTIAPIFQGAVMEDLDLAANTINKVIGSMPA